MSNRAIVTNGENHYTRAVLRSLGKRGIPVTVAAEHKNVQAYYPTYCRNFMIYPCQDWTRALEAEPFLGLNEECRFL